MPTERRMQTISELWFGSKDGAKLLGLIEPLMQVRTARRFQNWAEVELQHVLPHERMACGVGPMTARGLLAPRVLTSNFPEGYIDSLRRRGGGIETPVMARWRREYRPQLFDAEQPFFKCDPGWVRDFRDQGMRNCLSHGVKDVTGDGSSYFSFCRVPGSVGPRHGFLLDLLVPHMHIALGRIFAKDEARRNASPTGLSRLTEREYDVLTWMKHGKTNWEIGELLRLSTLTVKTHVQRILTKLQVSNRTQAVAKVIAHEMIGVK